jgi:uncharacterized protein (TIGR02284 family)
MERAQTHEQREGAHALEGLLTICSDGVEGYRRAAVIVRAPHLRAILQRNEVEREEIASVLTNILVELGARHDHAGTLKGAVHRGLLAALAAAHADDAIIRECARGDQMTLAAFAEALRHELPADVRDRVQAQLARVLQALGRLSSGEGTDVMTPEESFTK